MRGPPRQTTMTVFLRGRHINTERFPMIQLASLLASVAVHVAPMGTATDEDMKHMQTIMLAQFAAGARAVTEDAAVLGMIDMVVGRINTDTSFRDQIIAANEMEAPGIVGAIVEALEANTTRIRKMVVGGAAALDATDVSSTGPNLLAMESRILSTALLAWKEIETDAPSDLFHDVQTATDDAGEALGDLSKALRRRPSTSA